MSVEKIIYNADLVGVHPSAQTGSGYKFDHDSYSVLVNLSTDLMTALNAAKGSGTLLYRFDVYDAAGGHIHTEEQELNALNSIELELTKRIVRYSGNIKIIPVITAVDGELTIFERRLGIISLCVKATPETEDEEYREAISLSTLERAAKDAAATALAAKADCLAAQEATEAARFALEGNNTTVIFDGGDAETEFPVNIVVDDFLSQNGTNTVTARKIAEALALLETNIKSWARSTFSISAIKAAVKEEMYAEEYAVGSVKVSFDSEYDPNGILPGIWELIGAGRTIICAGTDAETGVTYEVNDTGGEAEHVLTVEEMPEHRHKFRSTFYHWESYEFPGSSITLNGGNNIASTPYNNYEGNVNSVQIVNTGGGQAHNNLPPYIVAYIWRRVEDGAEE